MKKSITLASVILATSMLFSANASAGGSKPAGPPAALGEVGASPTVSTCNARNIFIAGEKD